MKQYDNKANSSLLLTTDSRRHDVDEATGEPETLRGKIDPKQFRDKVYRGRPIELEEKIKKSKKKQRERDDDYLRDSKRRRIEVKSVLDSLEEGVYKPKTKESCAA